MSQYLELAAYSGDKNNEPETHIHNLGSWILNTRTNQLIQGERKVDLENRLTLLLVYLLQHRHQTLTKGDILRTLWQGKVVNEDSLAVAISLLRKALEDNPRAPKYIKTIPGVGYQFIWPSSPSEAVPINSPNTVDSRTYLPVRLICASIIILLVFIVSLFWFTGRNSDSILLPAAVESLMDEHALYERASTLLARRQKNDLLSAIPLFRQVIAQNPQAAEAYLGIAEAKIELLEEQVTEQDNDDEVRALLMKALELNPNLARAHMWLAHLLLRHDHDLRAAEQHFKISLELNPRDDLSHFLYEQLLLVEKRFDEARKHIALAREINPLTYPYTYLVWVYLLEKKNDLAAQELERIATTEFEDSFFHTAAQNVYYGLGREDKVYEHMRWFFDRAGYDSQQRDIVDHAYHTGGLNAVYAWLLNNKEMADVGQYQPPLSWARYAIALGKKQEAMEYLEQAYEKRQFRLICAVTDPRYDPLRGEPRFQALLNKLTGGSRLTKG
jgi:DNA-binding winged helix-turn-helix (wHTH) protein/Tfp pilus assembly protein PilF